MSAREGPGDAGRVRLHVVTGKGGTGKTTVAASLALTLASRGGRVLLVEVEGRQGIAQLFGCPPLPYEERKVADAAGGGEVVALAVDAEAALMEYLEMFYGMRRAGSMLSRFGVVDFATTIAPGLRDVLVTGKATEAVRRRSGNDRRRGGREGAHAPFVYNAVVMDAPPTGQIAQFLNVSSEVAGLARVGPVRNHADKVMSTVRSPETAVHFVSVLEEMPAQECVDGITDLTAIGLNVGSLVVNMVRDPLFDTPTLEAAAAGELDTEALARGLKAAMIEQPEERSRQLATEITAHARRIRVETAIRRQLAATGYPMPELPLLSDGITLDGLHGLAGMLREQGMGCP